MASDHLKMSFQTFDDVWHEIAPHLSGHPDAIQAARVKLAERAIGLFKTCGPHDASVLKAELLKVMFAKPTGCPGRSDLGSKLGPIC